MATKRGDKSRLQLTDFRPQRKEKNDFIEKVVLPTDTLQGIALLYNTTVADLKKLNHLHSDIELHAHRIIKVPSKGILINLEPETVPVYLSTNDEEEELLLEEEEDEVEKNGQLYLKSVDASLKEIREKVETVAANSLLNGSESPIPFRKVPDQGQGELKWWKVFLPCLGTLIVFPILYFIYRHNLFIPVPLHSNETHTHLH